MKTPIAHRQGLGDFYAVPASHVRPFDELVWNYSRGESCPITDIRSTSPQFITVTEQCADQSYQRRLKRDRLVIVRSLAKTYAKTYNDQMKAFRHYGDDPQRADCLSLIQTLNDAIANPGPGIDRDALAVLYGQRDATQDYLRSMDR